MSKELDFLREDYTNVKKEVEANNKILEDLLLEPLVRLYRDTYLKTEEKKKELETLGVSLAYQEMTECEHLFVRTEVLTERDYDRVERTPIYHCLKCGLTNEYDAREINPVLLNKLQTNMSYLFKETAKNGIILHEKRTCPLETARKIYEEIENNTKDLNLSKEEIKMCFLVLLSKSDPTYYQDLTYVIKRLAGLQINEDSKISQRIELRQGDIPVVENGITCYELSDFTKDLFKFVRTIKKITGEELTSLEDISKYPELVNEELEKLSIQEKSARLDNMAIPNPRAFVVAHDKVQDFKNTKSNPEIVKRNEEIAQKFKINNKIFIGQETCFNGYSKITMSELQKASQKRQKLVQEGTHLYKKEPSRKIKINRMP